jgi:hypothetical protein
MTFSLKIAKDNLEKAFGHREHREEQCITHFWQITHRVQAKNF